MTDHTIEAHFQVSSVPPMSREDRIVHAMALAIGGNRVDAWRAANSLRRAFRAMREAERLEEPGGGEK